MMMMMGMIMNLLCHSISEFDPFGISLGQRLWFSIKCCLLVVKPELVPDFEKCIFCCFFRMRIRLLMVMTMTLTLRVKIITDIERIAFI